MISINISKCPYCNFQLLQVPARKKQCKNCLNYFYVRTLPSTRERMIVTEEEKEKIDLEWQEINGISNQNLEKDNYYKEERKYQNKKKINTLEIDTKKFVALDLETANEKRFSICSIGLVVIENNEIIREKGWIIKPPEIYFNLFNVKKHGINEEIVKNKPEFIEIWDDLKLELENKIVFCHNAGFDIWALKEIIEYYNLEYPLFYYQCSISVAKKVWATLADFKLKTLMKYFNYNYKKHDSIDDARACSSVIINACKQLNINTEIKDLTKRLKLKLKTFPPY